MLRTLHIENIAVIKCVDITFDAGLTVLTGETGAGKSILIDSVSLLLGGKFSREIIRTGESGACVSAVFDSLSEETVAALTELGYAPDEDGTLLLRRVLQADGKSTLRLGGQPITATLAREIGRYLLNIHGQNDNQRLLQKSTHLRLLDAMGDYEREKTAYAAAYERLRACEAELAALGQSDAEKLRLSEMLTYQIKDIEAVKLKTGEIASLERERERLRNIEKIEKHVKFAATVLDSREKSASVAYLLGRGSASLRQIADVIPEAGDMAEQLDDMMYRVRDMAENVRAWSDDDAGEEGVARRLVEGIAVDKGGDGHIGAGGGVILHRHHLLHHLAGRGILDQHGHLLQLGLHLDGRNGLARLDNALHSLNHRLGCLLNCLNHGLSRLLNCLDHRLCSLLNRLHDGLGRLFNRLNHGLGGLFHSLDYRLCCLGLFRGEPRL